jgi:hypothetical protein
MVPVDAQVIISNMVTLVKVVWCAFLQQAENISIAIQSMRKPHSSPRDSLCELVHSDMNI